MKEDFKHDVLGNGGVRIAIIGVLAILSLFLVAQTVTSAQNFGRPVTPATDTITVSGTGQATLAPDIANISFSVQNTAATVAEAQTASTKQANAALDYVKGQGIAEKDVKTTSYNISPQYSYPNPCQTSYPCPAYTGTPKITGYEVSETVSVKVRKLESVGTLLEGLGKLGVQNVNGPNFALEDINTGPDAARADAIANARSQAQLLAGQLGVRLGKIVNFSESNGGYNYPMMNQSAGMYAKDAAAPAPQIAAGENSYSASVSITYEIR